MRKSDDDEKELAVLVITFGISITNVQLDALLKHGRDDQEWEHLSMPVRGRDRLLEAINKAIATMTDKQGRILRDDKIWKEAVDGEAQ
jgi:hypothetical protein